MISSKYQFTGGQVKHQNEVIVEKIIQIQNKSTGVQMLFPHLNFKKWPDHKTPDIENYVKLFEILFNFVDTCRTNNKINLFLSIVVLESEELEYFLLYMEYVMKLSDKLTMTMVMMFLFLTYLILLENLKK